MNILEGSYLEVIKTESQPAVERERNQCHIHTTVRLTQKFG